MLAPAGGSPPPASESNWYSRASRAAAAGDEDDNVSRTAAPTTPRIRTAPRDGLMVRPYSSRAGASTHEPDFWQPTSRRRESSATHRVGESSVSSRRAGHR